MMTLTMKNPSVRTGALPAGAYSEQPLTIEILALGPGGTHVVDRVIGATLFVEEAKRIGQRLLLVSDIEPSLGGYLIMNSDDAVIYSWRADADAKAIKWPL
jgi:hypothetical protein